MIPRRLCGVLLLLLCLVAPQGWSQTDDDGTIQGSPDKAAPGSQSTSGGDNAAQQRAMSDPELDANAPRDRGILPTVRLTPRRVDIAGLDDSRQYLHGTWDYLNRLPENFNGDPGSIDNWDRLEVPGHPVLQGYDKMPEEIGAAAMGYHHRFDVPRSWQGRRVILRFEGVDGLSKIWINGKMAGSNDIATLPSEYDITDHLNFGSSNDLTMSIEKSLVTLWSRRELGGINREVYLQALPTVNLARLHVDTQLASTDGPTSDATAHARVRVANQGEEAVPDAALRFTLRDAAGQELPQPLQTRDGQPQPVLLPPLAPGQTLELTVPLPVSGIERWTAESPTLYELTAELVVGEELQMNATQAFGFRTVEVVGPELRVNGSPVKLRGTNYHITYPGRGELVPRELIKRDLELFLDANFNTLRSRPTPSYDYVELCDQMGMYTTVEAMVTLMIYAKGPSGDHGADPAIAGPLRHHMATMIESYYSNPSVLTWGLGNECPYYDYFKVAAVGMHAADPSRPLFFGSDARLGVDIPFMDINDDHYPRAGHKHEQPYAILKMDRWEDASVQQTDQWEYNDQRPIIFTEWLHVHTNNWKEVAFDPGIDDFWGYYAKAHLDYLYDTRHFAGGFHFKGAPYRGIGASDRWRGVFEGDRTPNSIFWPTKKSHSPVRIEQTLGAWDTERGAAVYEIENRFDFTNLKDVTFEWSRGDASGRASADVEPHETGALLIPLDKPDGERIVLSVKTSDGRLVDRYGLEVATPQRGERMQKSDEKAADQPWEIRESDGKLTLSRGEAEVVVDRDTGLIVAASVGGEAVFNGSPTLLLRPSQLRNFKWQAEATLVNQAAGWQAGSVDLSDRDDVVTVTARGAYTMADATFTTRFRPDGRIEVACEAQWTDEAQLNLFAAGIVLPVAPALDTLRWEREGLWSWYPEDDIGRTSGEAPALGSPEARRSRQDADPDSQATASGGGGGQMSTPTQEGEGDAGQEQEPAVTGVPWHQQLVYGVTRDFRSTKFFVRRGGLFADDGRGVRVLADADRHLHATPAGDDIGGNTFVQKQHGPPRDGFDLAVLSFHNGGTEPHLTKSLRLADQATEKGWSFRTTATFELVSP